MTGPETVYRAQFPELSALRSASSPAEGGRHGVTGGPLSQRLQRALALECPPMLARVQQAGRGWLRKAGSSVISVWRWIQSTRQSHLASRRLVLCESVSLGEKRLLAIVKVDGRQFLVGAASESVSMLFELPRRGKSAHHHRRQNDSEDGKHECS